MANVIESIYLRLAIDATISSFINIFFWRIANSCEPNRCVQQQSISVSWSVAFDRILYDVCSRRNSQVVVIFSLFFVEIVVETFYSTPSHWVWNFLRFETSAQNARHWTFYNIIIYQFIAANFPVGCVCRCIAPVFLLHFATLEEEEKRSSVFHFPAGSWFLSSLPCYLLPLNVRIVMAHSSRCKLQ